MRLAAPTTVVVTLLLGTTLLVAQQLCSPTGKDHLIHTVGVGLGGGHIDGQSNLTIVMYASTCPAQPHPAAILVHGGGFTSGSNNDLNQYSLEIALFAHGFAVFSVNYRLAPGATISNMVSDIQRSVRYVRHEAPRFNVDPDRIVLIGDEAGGYLVALAALTPPQPGTPSAYDWDRESDEVHAVVVVAGAGDFGNNLLSTDKTEALTLLGWTTAPGPKPASPNPPVKTPYTAPPSSADDPLSLVSTNALPFLFVQGDEGEAEPAQRAATLFQKLQTAGDHPGLILIPLSRLQVQNVSAAGRSLEWQQSMVGWVLYVLGRHALPDAETAESLHVVQ